MRRWLPSPLLSFSLWALWLLLNDSIAPIDVIAGAVVGCVVPLLSAPLSPARATVRRPLLLALLILRVGADVIVSAVRVAAGVLSASRRTPNGSFVVVPLDLRDPNALAALAIITAVIPGTVWSELAPDCSALLVHVFDLEGEAEFIEHYKGRYERPLKEIFNC